jgi:integrase
MTGKIKNMVNRKGRYHARLVVPKDLRGIVGKTELRTPLGGDYRAAVKLLPSAVAQLQQQIAVAERQAGQGKSQGSAARYSLTPDQIAHSHYAQRLAFDDLLRNDPRYAGVGIDDVLISRLRMAIAGRADDEELVALVGAQIDRFRASGNLDAEPGGSEWRVIARALCSAELEALARVIERDEGDFTGQPTAPIIKDAQLPVDPVEPVSVKQLWADYVEGRQKLGYMRDGGRRQVLAVDSLISFLGHEDAVKITKKNLSDWRDHSLTQKHPTTISKVYLPTVRSLFKWAVEKELMKDNPSADIRLAVPKKMQTRERGYTTKEAIIVLGATRTYRPKTSPTGKTLEAPKTTAAKIWVPWLCAFSGARVAEIAQLRRKDFREEDGAHIIRITPDAGGTKTSGWRDVPLHPQIISLGFLRYVDTIPNGPIFHNATKPTDYLRHAKKMANRVGDWLHEENLVPPGVQPSHGWRHRFKTVGRELEIQDRVLDAIQGHAARTAGGDYGDVTLKTKVEAISKMPKYDLE